MTGVAQVVAIAALVAIALAAQGCGALVEDVPADSPAEVAPPVTPDAPAAQAIGRVTVPALARDGAARRAEQMTVRVRNLTCRGVATGSGFAVTPTTLITNRHVVAGADRLEVDTADGTTLEVGAAEVAVRGDVAVVSVVDGTLPVVAEPGGSVAQGSPVAAVGYPLGGPFTITRGLVVRRLPGDRFGIDGDVVEISAVVRPGNSGGPLLDRRGRVAGVVFALDLVTGLGIAMPMDTVTGLLERGGTTAVPPCGSE